MIDIAGSLSTCSLSALLAASREFRYLFSDFHTTMQRWEAQPALEVDIFQADNAAITQALVDTLPESLNEDDTQSHRVDDK